MDDDENHQLHIPLNIASSLPHDTHMVRTIQHLIEKCLTFSMDREECARCLEQTANLKPSITRIVWDELEKSNIEFFTTYSKNRKEALNNAHGLRGSVTSPASASSSDSSNVMRFQKENQKDG